MARPSAEEGHTEDEQDVAQHRADQRRLDHRREAGAQREDATNSSGRLPMLDCSKPVGPGPRRSPICSIDSPTSAAKNGKSQRGDHETGDVGGAGSVVTPDADREDAGAGDGQALRSPEGVGSAGHVVDLRRRYSDARRHVVQ